MAYEIWVDMVENLLIGCLYSSLKIETNDIQYVENKKTGRASLKELFVRVKNTRIMSLMGLTDHIWI